MTELSERDRSIVEDTIKHVSTSLADELMEIHRKAIEVDTRNRERHIRELDAIERALAMREYAVKLLTERMATGGNPS
jgi:hypothetical protein